MTDAPPLAGIGVLITRPADQASHLATLLAAEGGDPIFFPTLEIVPPSDPEAMRQALTRAHEYDWLVFVSPTAVDRSWPTLKAVHAGWPGVVRVAGVGPGTVRALLQSGAHEVLSPVHGGDSEHLLESPPLQDMRGQRVLIVRGEGGRPLLGDTLRQRGARVDYAQCYRRRRPDTDPAPVLERWRAGGIQAVACTSAEILANLIALIGAAGHALLAATPLFVPHARIASAAHAHGLTRVHTTAAGDAGILQGLREWFSHRHD